MASKSFEGTVDEASAIILDVFSAVSKSNPNRRRVDPISRKIAELKRKIRRSKKSLLARGKVPLENRLYQAFQVQLQALYKEKENNQRSRVKAKFVKARRNRDHKKTWEAATESLDIFKVKSTGKFLERNTAEAFF